MHFYSIMTVLYYTYSWLTYIVSVIDNIHRTVDVMALDMTQDNTNHFGISPAGSDVKRCVAALQVCVK